MPIRTSTLPSAKSREHLLDLRRPCGSGRPSRRGRGKSRKRSRKVFQCCSARIVVGASISTCRPFDGDREGGADGDLGLAEADVAADEPVHRPRRLEVLLHRLDRALLVRRSRGTGTSASSRSSHSLREVVGDALAASAAARRAAISSPASSCTDSRARDLEQLPRLAAELRERGRARVGADVARDLADLLVRDVEPVLAAEGEQEVVARDARDLLRLEAEQLADAVVLVDDVVAGAQVGERLERAAAEAALARRRAGGRPGGPGAATSPSSRQTKPRRAGETAKRSSGSPGSSLARLEQARLDLAQQVLRAAAPRRGAGRRRRRAGRSGRRPPARSRPRRARGRRSRAAAPRRRAAGPAGTGRARPRRRATAASSPSSSQTRRTSSGRPDEVRRAGRAPGTRSSGARRPPGPRRRRAASGSTRSSRRSRGGVERRLGDRVERALRERREGADGLDLVAEELDAERLAPRRREDVDDAAADGELAALRRPARRARSRRARAPRRGPSTPARQPGPRARPALAAPRPAADPPRARAPTRRRARPAPSTCSARARSPTRCGGGSSPESQATPRLGSRPTASSPRNQAAASAASRASASSASRQTSGRSEPLVQRREQQRQRRLGDAGARRQRLGELPEALELGELADEGVEDGRSMTSGGTGGSADADGTQRAEVAAAEERPSSTATTSSRLSSSR